MVDSFCCAIEETEIASAKADNMVAVFEFGQADELPDDRLVKDDNGAAVR
jgi:hypothetical protein